MRKAKIAIWAWTLLGVCAALGQAQTTGQSGKYCCEGYAFFGRRTSTPGTNVGGVGGDIFIYKGLAVGGDAGTTVGNPDNRITIWSVVRPITSSAVVPTGKLNPLSAPGSAI